jgi:hypothetical protein
VVLAIISFNAACNISTLVFFSSGVGCFFGGQLLQALLPERLRLWLQEIQTQH